MSSSESNSDTGPETNPATEVRPFIIRMAFEVDFLLAQARPGYEYPEYDPDGGIDQKFVCPPREGVDSAMQQVARMLGSNFQRSIIHPYGSRTENFEAPEHEDEGRELWHLCVSPDALALPGSPPEYNWLPIRMRTPFLSEPDMMFTTDILLTIELLRMRLKMHVNSSCPLRVILKVGPDPISLVLAKRVITQV